MKAHLVVRTETGFSDRIRASRGVLPEELYVVTGDITAECACVVFQP